MLNLFRGEVYRMLHKKKMYIYLGAVLLGYLALTFMRSGGFGPQSVADDANLAFQFMPALLGGYFFTSLYADDLTAKNLITLVGYGTSRTRIVITKLLLMVVFTTAIFAILTVLHLGAYAALGFAANGMALRMVLAIALRNILLTIGYALVASVVVYGTQRPTFAAVAYFMLAFSVVSMIITVAASLMDIDISGRFLSGTTSNILLSLSGAGGSIIGPGIEYLAYALLATIAAIFVFKHRELEF